MTGAIPVIDLRREDPSELARRAVARAIGEACESTGFFVIVGHGVPESLPLRMQELARAFFDGPLDRKLAVRASDGMGYVGPEGENLAASLDDRTVLDAKESLNLSLPVDPASWPGEPAELGEAAARYIAAMGELAAALMGDFARALSLPATYFDEMIDRPRTVLRLLNYPPQEVCAPGRMRAGAHTDYGTLTILWSEDVRGLQARTRAGEWVNVTAPPGAFVINIGDLMMNWTNDRWVSTLHRVVEDAGPARRRQSIAFFHAPNPDAVIRCLPTCHTRGNPPRYAPVTAWEHLQAKIAKSLGE